MLGIDIVNISRMQRLMQRFPQKGLAKFLNQDEICLIKNPQNAAGFFAAKEAASKALGTGIGKHCSFSDIIISKNKLNAPKIKFSKKIKKEFKIKKAYLSITHDKGLAIAVVFLKRCKKS